MQNDELVNSIIEYVENNLLYVECSDISDSFSSINRSYEKIFSSITGLTIREYIANRRLFLAALELLKPNVNVTSTAFKYGYETVEGFSRAYKSFHGFSPSVTKANKENIVSFMPISVSISYQGGFKPRSFITHRKYMKLKCAVKNISYNSSVPEIQIMKEEVLGTNPSYKRGVPHYRLVIPTCGIPDHFRYFICTDVETFCDKEIQVETIDVPELDWFVMEKQTDSDIEGIFRSLYRYLMVSKHDPFDEKYNKIGNYIMEIVTNDNGRAMCQILISLG